MEFIHKNMIAGVIDKGVEFYAVALNIVHAFHDGRHWTSFRELPSHIHDILRREVGDPSAPIEKLEEFAFQELGGFDKTPDICCKGSVNRTEFVEGVKQSFDNGVPITPAQMRVLKLIELTNCEIASRLFRSEHTVARQIQDMLHNSGIATTKILTKWASEKGII